MADRKQALQDLFALVEAGEATGRFGDLIYGHLGNNASIHASRAYNGDLKAAKALHEAVLPEFDYVISHINGGLTVFAQVGPEAIFGVHFSDDPARAWLGAILKALIAQEGET